MLFQIIELVLWPRSKSIRPRFLRFKPGQVNVISGASKTGKSAVIPIIDYCLASDSCAIPVGIIRQACSWFGARVVTAEGEKLLARREPGEQRSTADMFVLEGKDVQVPDAIEVKNASAPAIKRKLDGLAGLTNLAFEFGDEPGFRGRPSFRDLMAFCFQPQNVIANPDILFFKADTYEHREKLRTVFPYVLGAITPDLMAKQWELDDLSRELRSVEREFAALQAANERWLRELSTWLMLARELGLVRPERLADTDPALALHELRRAAEQSSDDAAISEETIDQALSEIVELEKEETARSSELSIFRRRLHDMKRLSESVEEYAGALRTQIDRLALSKWLKDVTIAEQECILCGSDFRVPKQELDQLCVALGELEVAASRFLPAPQSFQREFLKVEREIRILTDSLSHIRRRRKVLEERSEQTRRSIYRRTEIDRFLGRLEQAIATYDAATLDSDLATRLDALRMRTNELSDALSRAEIERRLTNARQRVEHQAAQILPRLDAEWPDAPIKLLTDDLTIKVLRPERDDYLWEVGSGANWLAYHVSVTLALQQIFLQKRDNPVPGLLIYDQPSQVYFPMQLAGTIPEVDDPVLGDEDAVAVRKVFEVLGHAATQASGRLQIVVLDHAGENVWGGIDGVELVEEWRGPDKLVPESWL